MTALSRLSLFLVLVSDSAGVCHFQAFLPSFRIWVFPPALLSTLLLHPPSFSPSLAFVSTILWLVFSHSHSSLSIPVDDPVVLSCIYFCSACGSDSQTRGVISSCGCSSSLRSMLSMLPTCILSSALPSLQSVLLEDKQPQKCMAFPWLFDETEITTSRLFASLPLLSIITLILY